MPEVDSWRDKWYYEWNFKPREGVVSISLSRGSFYDCLIMYMWQVNILTTASGLS